MLGIDEADVEEAVVHALAPRRSEACGVVLAVPDEEHPEPPPPTVELDRQRLRAPQDLHERYEQRRPFADVTLEPLPRVHQLAVVAETRRVQKRPAIDAPDIDGHDVTSLHRVDRVLDINDAEIA